MGALGGAAENRFTSFDSVCTAKGCGDPGQPVLQVNTTNLNLYLRVTDLNLGGPGPALSVEHSYNSDDQRSGVAGNGWSFSLGDTLVQDSDSSWILRRGSGRADRFGPGIDPTQFFAITATNDTLSRSADGSFTLQSAATGTVRSFSKDGRLMSIQDAGVTRVALDYDATGRLTGARPYGAASRRIQFSYSGGLLTAMTDASGRTVTLGYDGQGNLVQQINADGSTVGYGYDGNGRLVSITTGAGQTAITYGGDAGAVGVASVTLPDASTRQYNSAGGRQVQVTDGAGNNVLYAATVAGQTQSVTDGAGNVTAYAYDSTGRKTSVTNANGNLVKFEYDGSGNLTAVTDALQNRSTASYNGTSLTQFTDADKNTWRFNYDAAGRVTSFADPYGNGITYTRNAAGQVTGSMDANSSQNTFQYDADGLLSTWVDALGGNWIYQYDGAQRVAARTGADGNTVSAVYDAQGRIQAANIGASNAIFDYSALGRDGMNRLAASADGFGNVVNYGYDANGRLATLTLPGGNAITYQYDSAGRLAKVADWMGDFAVYKYDAAGQVNSVSTPGPVTVYQYDAASNLRAVISAGTSGSVLSGYRYTPDSNGNRLTVSAVEPSTAALNVKAESRTYDKGNRLSSSTLGQTYRYDANSNLIGVDGPGAASYSYDPFGRLTAVAGASTAQYAYGGLGLRTERNANGTVRRFVYDLSGDKPRVVMETDGANNPVAYYVWGLGPLWKVDASGKIYFYHLDGDGNVVALSTQTTGIVNRYRYDPMGRLVASDESVENDLHAGAASGWIDDGDGLLYGGGDYYAPDLRRTLPGTINLGPPNPVSLPRFGGTGACFFDGVTDCAVANARRPR